LSAENFRVLEINKSRPSAELYWWKYREVPKGKFQEEPKNSEKLQ
jgi:hypothetical protein